MDYKKGYGSDRVSIHWTRRKKEKASSDLSVAWKGAMCVDS